MELRGKQATHDFLSLYAEDSSLPRPDPMPSSQGFFVKTHDFLRPLERAADGDDQPDTGAAGHPAAAGKDVLPGGIGTFSIRRVASDLGSWEAARPGRETGPAATSEFGTKGKPEPDCDPGVWGAHPRGSLLLWGDSASGGQSPSPFTGATHRFVSFESLSSSSSSRHHPAPERRKLFMKAASRFSRGFDDDEEFARREASSSSTQLTVGVDGKDSGSDQMPTSPRSKHSAMEQRRRSKINDRFQMLRELLPHSDQKRDKASFLLEVIEYIQFLQEKVRKHESTYPGENHDNSKLMPWVKVYYRSFWKNAQNNSPAIGDGASDPSQIIKDGSALPAASGAQNSTEIDMSAGSSDKATEGLRNPANNTVNQDQGQWSRSPGAADHAITNEMLSEEELTIDDGTINFSSTYSQGLLTTLTRALQNSGLDLSQASISVQINLGRRTKRSKDNVTISGPKAIGQSRTGASGDESPQATKRQKADKR